MVLEDWLRSSLPALLRYATVLCGPGLAEDTVRDVSIKIHTQWTEIEASRVPTPTPAG